MAPTAETQSPILSLAAIERAFSKQRLDAHALPTDRDEVDRVARYMWNIALGTALHPSLHVFEVTLRNAIYGASLKVVDSTTLRMLDVKCWLDAEPSLLYAQERDAVEKAKKILGANARVRTPGHLLAKLGFGFWVQLTAGPYSELRAGGPQLWPKALPFAFPFRWPPHAKKNVPGEADRKLVYNRLNAIRLLRNRIAHHEPIWDRDLDGAYKEMLETLGWMSRKMTDAVSAFDAFPEVLRAGVVAYRPQAERLLHGPVPPSP